MSWKHSRDEKLRSDLDGLRETLEFLDKAKNGGAKGEEKLRDFLETISGHTGDKENECGDAELAKVNSSWAFKTEKQRDEWVEGWREESFYSPMDHKEEQEMKRSGDWREPSENWKELRREMDKGKDHLLKPTCQHCGDTRKHAKDLKRCGRCKVAIYCGAKCQKGDWRRHKKVNIH